MASDFLENLKKAADTGEFNSETAKKITEMNEITKKVNTMNQDDIAEKAKELDKENGDMITAATSTEYELKMEEFKEADMVNNQLATLIDIEDMVKLSIEDMMGFVSELEVKFEEKFKENNPKYTTILNKIEMIKQIYKPIINS